jgi:thioredoxin reductase
MALNLTTWTRDIVICTNGEDPDLTQELEQKLDALGIPLITDRVLRVHLREGGLRSLVFAHTPPLGCEEIFFTIGQHPADDLGVQLGCKRDEGGHIIVDAHYHTSVLNVYAAGDIVPGPQLAISAASDGAIAALSMHKSLVPEERKLS